VHLKAGRRDGAVRRPPTRGQPTYRGRRAWRVAATVSVGLLAIVAVGCGTKKRLPFEPGGGPPSPDATFTKVQNEVFSVSCAFSGCHVSTSPPAGMNLLPGAAYGNTVGVRSTERGDLFRIDPGDPDLSYLVKKIRGDPDIVGSPMPLIGGLTAAQRQLVIDWVRRGAPKD
jgi:hypothetical protein